MQAKMTGPRHGRRCESRDVNLAPWDTRVLGCLLTEEAAESLNSTCDSSFAGGVEGPLKASAPTGSPKPAPEAQGQRNKTALSGVTSQPSGMWVAWKACVFLRD